jgi:enoyl-CoA hydratase/carnithine racemase
MDLHGPVAELRLDNPGKLNAFTPDMLGELLVFCEALDQASDIRAVIVTAAPAKAFCTGADITIWGGCRCRRSRCCRDMPSAAGWNWPPPATSA